ncbi:hypothetical protein ACLB2K_035556 [Fragaria x ananassa]
MATVLLCWVVAGIGFAHSFSLVEHDFSMMQQEGQHLWPRPTNLLVQAVSPLATIVVKLGWPRLAAWRLNVKRLPRLGINEVTEARVNRSFGGNAGFILGSEAEAAALSFGCSRRQYSFKGSESNMFLQVW